MAGDPWCEPTTTSFDWTNTESTTTGYNDHYYIVQRVENSDEYQEKIKELIRRKLIKDMKATWKQNKKEFKPLPKLRPSAQLRGVCFSGRGWG